jgi:hypothetical protein
MALIDKAADPGRLLWGPLVVVDLRPLSSPTTTPTEKLSLGVLNLLRTTSLLSLLNYPQARVPAA